MGGRGWYNKPKGESIYKWKKEGGQSTRRRSNSPNSGSNSSISPSRRASVYNERRRLAALYEAQAKAREEAEKKAWREAYYARRNAEQKRRENEAKRRAEVQAAKGGARTRSLTNSPMSRAVAASVNKINIQVSKLNQLMRMLRKLRPRRRR